MKHTLLTLLLLFTFTACQDKETESKIQAAHDAQIKAQTRLEVLAELSQKTKTSPTNPKEEKLEQMGISIQDDVISIDTNKSKQFLKTFSDKMAKHMQKASDDFKKGMIQTKEAGIDISNDHINIDLNKTKSFLQEWSQQFQVMVKEMDEVTSAFESNTSK